MNRRRWGVVAAIASALALALGLSACGSGSNATAKGGSSGSEPTTIRYQTGAGVISQLEMAKALGYLGDLEPKAVGAITGGPESIQAVATGQADITGPAFAGAFIKAIAAGASIKAVIGGYGSEKSSYQALYVLDDSSIKSAKDLVGKKIGVNTLGGTFEAWMKIWLKEEGLSPAEVESVQFVVIPPVNAEQALREKQLDAVGLSGQLLELAVSKGGVRPVVKDIEVLGPYTNSFLGLNDDFIEEHPETTAKLVTGLAKATRYLQTAPRAQVIRLAQKVATENGRPEDAESLKFWKSQGIVNRGGVITGEFELWNKWLEEEGEPALKDPGEAFTNQFNPYAKEASTSQTAGGNGG